MPGVQWSGLHAATAGGTGPTPGRGSSASCGVAPSKNAGGGCSENREAHSGPRGKAHSYISVFSLLKTAPLTFKYLLGSARSLCSTQDLTLWQTESYSWGRWALVP